MGEPVYLVGEANEVGAVQGQLQREVLRERLDRLLARAALTQSTLELRERAQRFGRVLEQATPHWLEEAQSLAAAAGCELWSLLALNCLPYNFWGNELVAAPLELNRHATEVISAYDAQGYEPLLGGDCTTYFALGSATISGETLFHKNRDERDEVQCVYTKQVDGWQRFIGAGDIGNLGTAHLHTENYWVGANNTGSSIVGSEYEDCALHDGHVLRYLAEHCRTLEDILPALETLIENNWMGGGGVERGMILLFADARRALIVEATSRRMAHEWFEEDAAMGVRTNHFLLPEMQKFCLGPDENSARRYDRARNLWEAQEGFLVISTCGELARDRVGLPHAICRNPSDNLGSCTVSTSTATISTHDDRRCQTHFRNCHPSYTHTVILTPLDRVSDSDLVSGAHNQHWRNYRGWA
ncbi:MAG: hypothetical protein JWN98_590 [Abditibacteriota bacterium]|nr:hypothetical protein [Abditibacteriota bacterium]